jgi:hypothetical protein
MHPEIAVYNLAQPELSQAVCAHLATRIDAALPGAESKIWHKHPVWFLDGNPIVGYSVAKHDVRLLFWSGQSFSAPGLVPEGSFKAAEVRYQTVADIDAAALTQWLTESRAVQWDYKNIAKRKGALERLM